MTGRGEAEILKVSTTFRGNFHNILGREKFQAWTKSVIVLWTNIAISDGENVFQHASRKVF